MTKHMILWKIKDEYSDEQKAEIRANVKKNLEGLTGQIPGLLSMHIRTEFLPSSNADVMMDSTFESPEAMNAYAKHPAHVAVADTYVRPYMQARLCMDYEE